MADEMAMPSASVSASSGAIVGAKPSASGSASTREAPREVSYTMPSLGKPELGAPPSVASALAQPAAQPIEIVTRPTERTLARGKYEATPLKIWLIVAGGAIFLLLYTLMRLRRGRLDRKRAMDALVTLKKA